MGQLDGKVAIITGAGRGQGEATARLFAENGARLIITDIAPGTAHKVAASLGENAIGLDHDICSEQGWREVAQAALSRFGRIDVLVNNAGILMTGNLATASAQDFERAFQVNVIGGFLGIKEIAQHITKPGGAIVNIASSAGMHGGPANLAYTASKWAMRGLSRSLALELAKQGVRVNAICPGLVDTPMLGKDSERTFLDRVVPMIPLGRMGEPGEIAAVSLFLASDAASFMSGSEIVVDGGREA